MGQTINKMTSISSYKIVAGIADRGYIDVDFPVYENFHIEDDLDIDVIIDFLHLQPLWPSWTSPRSTGSL